MKIKQIKLITIKITIPIAIENYIQMYMCKYKTSQYYTKNNTIYPTQNSGNIEMMP